MSLTALTSIGSVWENPLGLALPSRANQGCRLCHEVALLTQTMVLTSKVPGSSAQGACRTFKALAGIPCGLPESKSTHWQYIYTNCICSHLIRFQQFGYWLRLPLNFLWLLRDGERSSRVKIADRGFASRQSASLVSIKRGKF